jgi:hypothetical protein
MNLKFNLNLKSFLSANFLVWPLFIVLFGALFYVLKPLLTNQVLMGWDLPAHYYLTDQMLSLLEHFRLSGFNIYGFAGYPMFTFYNPLPYVTVCLLHLLSFKLIPLYLSFNIVLFILPFIYLISVYYASCAFFDDKKVNLAALLFGFLTLFLVGNNGLGFTSEVNVGLFLNAFACPIMLFLLGVLERLRKTEQKKYLFWSIGLFAMLILSHIFTVIFFCFILLIYTILNFKQFWKKFLLIGFATAILTSFWWVPFVLNMGYTSAQTIIVTNDNDPIFGIFPKFLFGLLLFIFSCVGIGRLTAEKKYFFPIAFLVTILLIPRSIIDSLIKLPIHYYRFIADIAIFNIFLSAYGFVYILNWINSWTLFKKGNLFSKIPWVGALAVYLVWLMISINFSYVDIQKFQKDFDPQNGTFSSTIKEADKVLDYIKQNNLQGRILVDLESNLLVTKHYFDYILPSNKIFNARGLLYESSLSGRYIYPDGGLLFNYSNYTSVIYLDPKGSDKTTETIKQMNDDHAAKIEQEIMRLRMFGIKYLIVDNTRQTPVNDFIKSKYNKDLISQKTVIGSFSLLEINDAAPLIGKTDFKPFLFIDSGGIIKKISFASVSLQWEKSGYALDFPIIYTTKSLEKISDYDKSQISGYIVSYRNGKEFCPSSKQMDYWTKQGKPIIFLDSNADCQKSNENIYFVKSDNKISDIAKAYDIVAKISDKKFSLEEIKPELIENEQIKFNNNSATFVNFSYFPKWQSKDKKQTIFWISPSMMFVFAKGETEFNYK